MLILRKYKINFSLMNPFKLLYICIKSLFSLFWQNGSLILTIDRNRGTCKYDLKRKDLQKVSWSSSMCRSNNYICMWLTITSTFYQCPEMYSNMNLKYKLCCIKYLDFLNRHFLCRPILFLNQQLEICGLNLFY